MDASNLLKPALARGELHCIGATTLDEYRKHVEKDAALARRFQPVFVAEPTVEDTISILRGLKEKYELHHGVRITDAALVAAATLSNRYITDRFLPDKAIDLMDEAASRLRMQVDSKPEELDELDRRIMQLKIEREALKKETRRRLQGPAGSSSRRSWPISKRRPSGLTSRWQAEKDKLAGAQKLKEQLDAARIELEQAQRARRSRQGGRACLWRHPRPREEAAEDRGGRVEGRRHGAGGGRRRTSSRRSCRAGPASRSTRCWKASARSCCRWRRSSPSASSARRRRCEAVSNAVRRARAGLQDPNRPIGSFLFLGPDRRRQDRARQGARRVPVRRRARDGPHRHERVHGEAHASRG